ncbi:hypothetical protein BH18ACT4_BH18ACT4_03680 [soil metagenome]
MIYASGSGRVAPGTGSVDRALVNEPGTLRLAPDPAAKVAAPDDSSVLAVLATKAGCYEAALRITETALRVTGDAGFSKQVGVDRPYRDARAGFVMAPTSDALFDFTGRALCGMDLF